MFTPFIILLIILFVVFFISIYFSNRLLYPKTWSHEFSLKKEIETGRLNEEEYNFINSKKKEVYIKSPFGYNLYAVFIPVENSKKTIIICHGITWTLNGSMKYASMFLKKGFNVLMYDHRNHGKSGGKFTTYGFYEKQDLKACTDWVFEQCGHNCVAGTFGESMGAATALQNLAIDKRLSFCIADCAYSDLKTLLKYLLKRKFCLPVFPFLHLTELLIKIRIDISLNDISPIRDIQNVNTPIFFIHGREDRYVPTQMSVDMYNIKKGAKKLYLAPNAAHAESFFVNRKEYEKMVDEFLKKLNII